MSSGTLATSGGKLLRDTTTGRLANACEEETPCVELFIVVLDEDSDGAESPTNYVQIGWDAYTGCTVVNYTVQRREAPSGTWATIGTTAGTDYTDNTIEPGVEYEYRLLINCDAGDPLTSCVLEYCSCAAPDGPDDALLTLSGPDLDLTFPVAPAEGCTAPDASQAWEAQDPDAVEVWISDDDGASWAFHAEYTLNSGTVDSGGNFNQTIYADLPTGDWRVKVRYLNYNTGGICFMGPFGAPSNLVSIP